MEKKYIRVFKSTNLGKRYTKVQMMILSPGHLLYFSEPKFPHL